MTENLFDENCMGLCSGILECLSSTILLSVLLSGRCGGWILLYGIHPPGIIGT